MVAVANFIMRSRWHAVGTALFLSLLPAVSFLGAAVVALVTLRKGANEGALVLLAAFLPAFLVADGAVISQHGVSAAVFGSAVVFRSSVSMFFALLCAAIGAGVLVLATASFSAASIELVEVLLVESLSGKETGLQPQELKSFVETITMQAFSVGLFFSILASLFIGRWFQARLYNPGGFQTEFHSLRAPKEFAIGLLIAALLITQLLNDYSYFAALVLLPIIVSAIGFVHYQIQRNDTNVAWLFLFYIAVMLMSAFGMIMLLVIGLADSLLDFRQRQAAEPTDND